MTSVWWESDLDLFISRILISILALMTLEFTRLALCYYQRLRLQLSSPSQDGVRRDKRTESSVKPLILVNPEPVTISFLWKLENFASLPQESGKLIRSLTFTDSTKQTHWSLLLYPQGYSSWFRNKVSIYLQLDPLKSSPPVKVKFVFAVLDRSATRCHMSQVYTCLFRHGELDWGLHEFLDRSNLLENAANLLPHGDLIVTCDITIVEFSLGLQYPQYGYQLSWAMLRYAHFDLVLAFIGLEEEISVHQVVMCAASRVFAAMFEHDTQERRERRVEIEDFSPHIMQLLVHFAYHEAVELSSHSLDTLEALILDADKYEMLSLNRFCERHLASKLTSSNVLRVLSIADRHHMSQLAQDALDLVERSTYDVVTSQHFITAIRHQPELVEKTLKLLEHL